MLRSLFALLTLQRSLSSGSHQLIEQLLEDLAAVLMLAIAATLLAVILILGGTYLAYEFLIAHGLEPGVAMGTLGGVLLVLILALAASAIVCIRRMRSIPGRLWSGQPALVRRAGNVAEAFMQGLLGAQK